MSDLLRSGVPMLAELLEPALMSRLLDLGPLVRYQAGQLLHQRGDDKPGLSIVRKGRLIAGNVGMDGSVITSSLITDGDCFGEFTLFAGLPRTHDIYADQSSEVYQLPARPFMTLFDAEPEIARALLTIALIRNHNLLEFMDNLRRLPLIVRLARLLMGNVPAGIASTSIPCRQDELAFTLGVSRVSVGKVIKQLQAEGLIEAGYRQIHVPSVAIFQAWIESRMLLMPLTASMPPR